MTLKFAKLCIHPCIGRVFTSQSIPLLFQGISGAPQSSILYPQDSQRSTGYGSESAFDFLGDPAVVTTGLGSEVEACDITVLFRLDFALHICHHLLIASLPNTPIYLLVSRSRFLLYSNLSLLTLFEKANTN